MLLANAVLPFIRVKMKGYIEAPLKTGFSGSGLGIIKTVWDFQNNEQMENVNPFLSSFWRIPSSSDHSSFKIKTLSLKYKD